MHKNLSHEMDITRRLPVSGVQSGVLNLKGIYTDVTVSIYEWYLALIRLYDSRLQVFRGSKTYSIQKRVSLNKLIRSMNPLKNNSDEIT